MIWESHYWKNDLLKQAEQLRKRTKQKRWPDVSFARLEQTVMLGFYSIRKLIEASKVCDEIVGQQFKLHTFPKQKESSIHKMNWEKIDRHYDLLSKDKTDRNLSYLCNQFIHSYIFIPSFDDENLLDGIYFASDRQRKKSIHLITVAQIIEIFDQVGNDYPNVGIFIYDPKKQEYKISLQTHPEGTKLGVIKFT